MSYDNMDHAAWMTGNIAASKQRPPTAREKKAAAEGRGWHAAPDALNEFQTRAITILGIVGGGIYNAPINWDTAFWRPTMLSLTWRNSLSTIDWENLTVAVLLCHDAAIRLEIAPAMRDLRLTMHQRAPRQDGDGWTRGHPTITQAIERYRVRFPADHPVHYRAPTPPAT